MELDRYSCGKTKERGVRIYTKEVRVMSVEEKFMRATQYVADGDVQLSDSQRTAFYGLQKQAVDGDCNVAPPPTGNKSARSKYEAWNAYRGLSKLNAMEKYIAQLKKMDSSFDSDGQNRISQPSLVEFEQSSSPARVIMEGILYKQQDVFKGWSPRYFVLDDCFLHYYLAKGDDVPKKSIQIFGCTITSVRSTRVGDIEYFPFVISHHKSTKTYNLSADSKNSADNWSAALRDAAAKDSPPPMPSMPVDRLLERRPAADDDDASTANGSLQNAEMTRTHIPEKYAPKVEKAVRSILELCGSDQGWSPLFEKDGVRALKRVGGVVCVRADTVLPFSLLDIFSLIINENRQKDFDPSLKSCKRLKYFSDNTFVEHSRYKQVWPHPPRDFCNLVHWRILSDGTVVFLKFSEKFEELSPLEEGIVRAELIISGFVFRTSSKGTACSFILQNDLRGTLSASIVNLLSSTQPMCLRNIRKCLEDDANSSKRPALMSRSNKSVAYKDLLFAFESVKSKHSINGDIDDASSKSDQPATSSSDKVRNTIKSAVEKASDPSERKRKLHALNTLSLCVLLMPVALYYAVSSQYRAIAFLAGLLYSLEYIFRLHLGIPESKLSTSGLGAVPSGRMLVRFSADLGRLLRYLESRRESSGVEITVSHIALKAAAVALAENSSLNGHMISGDFYASVSKDVNISMSHDVPGSDSIMMKVDHADLKPIDYIADEIKRREKELNDGKDKAWHRTANLVGMLPPVVSGSILSALNVIGGRYGITIPFLGVVGFPHGVCTIITLPSKDSADGEIDVALIPSAFDTAAPISITIGGVRLQPVFDQDHKLAATHVLNVAIAVDSNAGSLAIAKKFCGRVQQLMNSPNLLDKADRIAAVSREDEKVKAEKAATHAAIFQK